MIFKRIRDPYTVTNTRLRFPDALMLMHMHIKTALQVDYARTEKLNSAVTLSKRLRWTGHKHRFKSLMKSKNI